MVGISVDSIRSRIVWPSAVGGGKTGPTVGVPHSRAGSGSTKRRLKTAVLAVCGFAKPLT